MIVGQRRRVEESFETETAAFLTVTKDKLVEWRIVVDEGLFRDVRDAMGRSSDTTEKG